MFRDENTKKDFAGSQNPWVKRLGLFIVIVGVFANYFETHQTLFLIIFWGIIILAVVWGILKIFVGDIKNLFK